VLVFTFPTHQILKLLINVQNKAHYEDLGHNAGGYSEDGSSPLGKFQLTTMLKSIEIASYSFFPKFPLKSQ
jgi:hypothetical protein